MNENPFSRQSKCRISDAITYCGLQTIVLENEKLRVVVLPEKGGEIYSIQYKPMDVDPLLHFRSLQSPRPFPETIPLSDGAFTDYYDGGWQVMFPSGGGPNAAFGMEMGRHGEAALLPWSWKILRDDPEEVLIRFWAQMVRTPFSYERVMRLTADETQFHLDEKITNHGGEPLPFMWGHHPAFGAPLLDGSCVVDVPAEKIESIKQEVAESRVPVGTSHRWPVVPGRDSQPVDLRLIPANGGHTADMFFLSGLEEGWYALTNRQLGLGFALTWDLEVFPVLWVWQEFGGSKGHPWYANTYALGLEPCTHYALEGANGLEGVIESGEAKLLAPGESLSVALSVVLYETNGAEGVAHVSRTGEVIFR